MHRMDGWTLSDPAGITAATTTIVRRSVETRMARVPRGAAFLSDSDDNDDDVLLDATLEDEPDRHVTSEFLSSQGAHIPARKCLQCSASPRATEANITELAGLPGNRHPAGSWTQPGVASSRCRHWQRQRGRTSATRPHLYGCRMRLDNAAAALTRAATRYPGDSGNGRRTGASAEYALRPPPASGSFSPSATTARHPLPLSLFRR